MERIIQPYSAHGSAPASRSASALAAHASPTAHAIPAKTPADMARALRRRWPLVVVMVALFGALGAAYVSRMPFVYKAVAHIQIDPPKFDPYSVVIQTNGTVPASDRESSDRFVPNRLVWLTGRKLADEVVARSDVGMGRGFEADSAAEITTNLTPPRRMQPGTNVFEVGLEGADPERVAKVLNGLLDVFRESVQRDSLKELDKAKLNAEKSLNQLADEMKNLEAEIQAAAADTPIFGPEGKNLLVEEHTAQRAQLMSKKLQLDGLRHEGRITSMYPGLKGAAPPSPYQKKIEYLTERKELYQERLEEAARLVRDLNNDPAARHWSKLLKNAMDDLEEMERLDSASSFEVPDRSALMLAHGDEEVRKLEREVKDLFRQVQETMPRYQAFQSLLRSREQKELRIATMRERLANFKMVMDSRSYPVDILQRASEPGGPIRPNRPMLIGLIATLGGLLGAGLVCLREFLDHSVKVPEHLAAGLTLPVLSVIPRMKRLARLSRGGHLWTANDANSVEADAYRNLRASLIGASGPKEPIVTLLVTSAKAGEGKSTTALNLALTCARAGERTLLMDVDLRRPSLAEVFDAAEPNVGLVDVLRGDMPWPQAVVRTDVANLNFLPTGDPSGVPIEVLGTLELRQLIAAVSRQYQRVILDAPAVLGLADCRMLGRAVDAAILVVRSGAHELRPLRRAKEMLEQSRVPLAGVVFNGLSEDLDNWSSYGSNALPTRSVPSRRGIDAPSQAAEA